jgi:hypothetical protein
MSHTRVYMLAHIHMHVCTDSPQAIYIRTYVLTARHTHVCAHIHSFYQRSHSAWKLDKRAYTAVVTMCNQLRPSRITSPISTYIRIHRHTHVHTRTHPHTYTTIVGGGLQTCGGIFTYKRTVINSALYACVVCVCLTVMGTGKRVYVCVCVCLRVREREREREIDRERE